MGFNDSEEVTKYIGGRAPANPRSIGTPLLVVAASTSLIWSRKYVDAGRFM